ncbi:MAG: hypothetical protein IT385_22680 [Deltaproteobacteria bacterium]|nr:hypothetical protein [Deltaproteobacteria bacterium]
MSGGWYTLVLSPAAWPAASQIVRADDATREGGTLTLWAAGRAVHRVPERLVLALERHETQRAATAALARARERGVGGATVHVAELGVVARVGRRRAGSRASGQGTAIPAEGIRFVIED